MKKKYIIKIFIKNFKAKLNLNLFILLYFINILSNIDNNKLLNKLKNINKNRWLIKNIRKDLSYFTDNKITNNIIEKTKKFGIEIIIKKGEIIFNEEKYKELNKIEKDRCLRFINHLNKLNILLKLKDTRFVINLSDGSPLNYNDNLPLFVFSKDQKINSGILIPDVDNLDFTCNKESLKELFKFDNSTPWNKKIKKLIWRGSPTDGLYNINNYHSFPRFKLVNLSLKYPQLIDAKFVNISHYFLQDSSESKELLNIFNKNDLVGKYMPINDHLKYQYNITIDGNTSSWSRLLWQLYFNTLCFKQSSDHIQWYYRALKPFYHYIPVSNDLSDLLEKLDWAKNNEEKAQDIIKNASLFAHNNLEYEDLLVYIFILLEEYNKLIVE